MQEGDIIGRQMFSYRDEVIDTFFCKGEGLRGRKQRISHIRGCLSLGFARLSQFTGCGGEGRWLKEGVL